jgi:hypothetical protein
VRLPSSIGGYKIDARAVASASFGLLVGLQGFRPENQAWRFETWLYRIPWTTVDRTLTAS